MTNHQTTLLLTRPEKDSAEFLNAVRARVGQKVPAIISPVLRIEPVAEVGDLSGFETIIVTSRNAVSCAGRQLSGRSVATVGARTAEAAMQVGANAFCLGEDVDGFLKNIHKIRGPALHLRGVHSRGNLPDRAQSGGVQVEERVIYDQVAQELSAEAKALLTTGHAVVPVFSPRTAKLLSWNRIAPETLIVVISRAASEPLSGRGSIIVASEPTRESMLDLVASAL